MIDALPPQNLEAETGVLGSVLMDNDVIDDVMDIITDLDFYRDSHQLIYRAIVALYARNERVDVITLEEELKRRGDLEKVGGLEAIFSILNGVPHAANAIYYAQIVRQKAVKRAAIEAAHKILKAGYSEETTAEEVVALAEQSIYPLSDAQAPRDVSLAEIEVPAVVRKIEQRIEQGFGPVGLSYGLTDVDSLALLVDEEMTILGARPGMGKTAFALQVCEAVARRENRPTIFFSFEMNNQQLATRMLSNHSGVPAGILKRATVISDVDRRRIHAAANDYTGMAPFILADTTSMTVLQIASTCRRAKNRYGDLGLVVVDYIQLINTPDSRDSRQEQIAKISRRLKTLGRELKVPMLALSQLNRGVENREDRRPRLADLRESGAIEQDADVVILLHRPEYYDPNDKPGVAEVIVAKNRNGATGTAELVFESHLTRFSDLQPEFV